MGRIDLSARLSPKLARLGFLNVKFLVLWAFAFTSLSHSQADVLFQNPAAISGGELDEEGDEDHSNDGLYVHPLVIGGADLLLAIGKLGDRHFFIDKPNRPGSPESARSRGPAVRLRMFLDVDRPGIAVSGVLTKFRFHVSAEEDGGWVLTPRDGKSILASGRFSGDFPMVHRVEVPLFSQSSYGEFYGSPEASGLALFVYSDIGTPGKRILIGYDLGVDGNVTVRDISGPRVNFQGAIPKSSSRAVVVLNGTVSDYSGVSRIYFSVAGGKNRISARLRGKRWTARLPLSPGINVFRMTAIDKSGRISRRIIRITRE